MFVVEIGAHKHGSNLERVRQILPAFAGRVTQAEMHVSPNISLTGLPLVIGCTHARSPQGYLFFVYPGKQHEETVALVVQHGVFAPEGARKPAANTVEQSAILERLTRVPLML